MSRYKNGNPKRSSRFICLCCLQENLIGQGIQRINGQREKNHKKNLYCVICNKRTVNLEVRNMDDFNDKMMYAKKIRSNYYDADGKYIGNNLDMVKEV